MGSVKNTRIRICKADDCHNAQTTAGFCRLHYLQNWKVLREQRQAKAAKRLNKYVERMTKKFPKSYVNEIKKELRGDAISEGDLLYEEPSDLQKIFADTEYREEVSQALRDLKIERDF